MSWPEIVKAVNSDVNISLDKLIKNNLMLDNLLISPVTGINTSEGNVRNGVLPDALTIHGKGVLYGLITHTNGQWIRGIKVIADEEIHTGGYFYGASASTDHDSSALVSSLPFFNLVMPTEVGYQGQPSFLMMRYLPFGSSNWTAGLMSPYTLQTQKSSAYADNYNRKMYFSASGIPFEQELKIQYGQYHNADTRTIIIYSLID